ncbi:MAG TPA: hypothetical protein PKI41_00935 [Candidatus Competibacteraceae bacterium]|nr:hypothetical protein [Candidatus Competibacteraceae bacterium]HQA26250.1 hypothetical protein [Candidatus Competibacteraceae bacterium]
MVKPWISEEIVKTWTDAQKRLWESLCSAVPFPPPIGVESWRETYLNNLVTWEAAVKKTLAQEVDWVEHWVHQVAEEKEAPEMMTSWVRQMEDVLQRWIQMQNQWWEEYFTVLRRSGFGGIGPAAVQEPPPPAEPVAPPAVTEPEPVIVVEAPAETVSAVAAEPPIEPVEVAPATEPVMEAEPVAAEPPIEPVEVAPAVDAIAEPADDLKLIAGIGPALEKKLQACGIVSYRQLAGLTDADIDQLETRIRSFGRIRRDDWIGQAKARHYEKYQEQL